MEDVLTRLRAHLLIDAAIYQHIMKHAFTEQEFGEMRTFIEKVAHGKMGARNTDPVVAVFEQRFEETFKRLGHHQYAKGARLYCQLIKQLEILPAYKETLEMFTAHGNHVVRYSSHDWSGTWCDICIEQTLMKAAKSEEGLNRGRMRNGLMVYCPPSYEWWVQIILSV